MERKLIIYKDGLSAKEGATYLPGQSGDPSITLKRGITKVGDELYKWFDNIQGISIDKKTVTISLMDETGEKPVVTWTVTGAFPIKIEAPSFNATSNEVAIETLQLAASKITIKYS